MNILLEKLARSSSWVMWLGRGLLLSIIVLLIIMRSLVTMVRVDGHSMDPTLRNGQWVFVNVASEQLHNWNFDDVVILRFPGDPIHSWYVKRIIGLPGDKIQLVNGGVVRNGQLLQEDYLSPGTLTEPGVIDLPTVVPAGYYIVFGDNRTISNDSRFFGLVPQNDLYGKVIGY